MVGLAYFVLAFLDSIVFTTSLRDVMLTEWILEESADALHSEFGKPGMVERAVHTALSDEERSRESFGHIGHCLGTLILATIGGLFASWLGRRRDGGKTQTGE